MSETFSVSEMRTHQASLQAVDGTTQGLVGQAADLGFGDWQMYGLFASPLICPVLALGNAAHGNVITQLGHVSTTATEAFGSTANLYEASEKANVDLMQSIMNQIEDTERRTRA